MRHFLIALTPIALAGCAGAIINGVRAPNPTYAKVIVSVEAHNLYDYKQPNFIQVLWAGYVAQAPVPVKGGIQPERFDIELEEWMYQPQVARAPATRMEVRYLLGNRTIRKRQFPAPFPTPTVIMDTMKKQREPEEVAERPPVRRTPGGRTVPKNAGKISRSLDNPTVHVYPRDLVCDLDAHSGPRYLRLKSSPNKLVQLTIDVQSHGDPRATSEVTWWSVELLDEKGRPLPHSEKEMVDVGGEFRHITEWRFDGSPVIFKLTTGSDVGDTIRVRFEEVE